MGKKMTKAGMELRRAVRADYDASPNIDHLVLRRNHGVAEGIVESAMTKTVAEWDALVAATPDDEVIVKKVKAIPVRDTEPSDVPADNGIAPAPPVMPGLAQGVVKFARKPAKMGQDYIFWIPRVYIKNGLVDPHVEYEVHLKKKI
jgi:hypothetical protein